LLTRVSLYHSGILITHVEFGDRAEFGANFAGGSDSDCNGHGTHVAGTVAGELYGVAKKATVIAVRSRRHARGGDAPSMQPTSH
jgi:subtilisin family serine protease